MFVKATEWIKRVHNGLPEAEQVPEQGRQEQTSSSPPRVVTPPQRSWLSGGQSDRTLSFSSMLGGCMGQPEASVLGTQSVTSSAMEKAAENLLRMSLDRLEGWSRDWPKFSGKVLAYAVWKKEWQRHHWSKYWI